MHLTDEMLDAIELELQKQVQRHTDQPGMSDLYSMISYHMGWEREGSRPITRGKRIRPLLVALSAAACGGDWQKSLPASAAVELIHNFSLIHDDIEDNSFLRRGRPTVWKMWGIPQAINTGDAMFSIAHLAIFDLYPETSQDIVMNCAQVLQQTCLKLTQGQYLDISFEQQNDVPLALYWQMVTGKTAALLAGCCQIGALIGGASPEKSHHYQSFGESLGLAFQAQDDVLGIWGDELQTGKSSDSDLVTGKKTLPVLFGLSQKGEFYRRWAQEPVAPVDVGTATQILLEEGAKEYTLKHANRLTAKALSALESALPIGQAGDEIRKLTQTLLSRCR
jgi:geranylgeranyl diphosphate synthase type I